MATVLGTLNTIPHNLVNIVASFMPRMAKTWSRNMQGRITVRANTLITLGVKWAPDHSSL